MDLSWDRLNKEKKKGKEKSWEKRERRESSRLKKKHGEIEEIVKEFKNLIQGMCKPTKTLGIPLQLCKIKTSRLRLDFSQSTSR